MKKTSNPLLKAVIGCSFGAILFASAWAQQNSQNPNTGGPQQANQAAGMASPSPSPSPSPTLANVVDTLASMPQFSNFVAAIQADDSLSNTLKNGGPYTLFAPTNAAFASLNQIDNDALQELQQDPYKFNRVILYGVVPGQYTTQQLMTTNTLTSQEGQILNFSASGGSIYILNVSEIPNAVITQPDIPASNGIIQGVNQILYPPGASV